MARADLLCDIIKYGLNGDNINFRKAAEAICAEERVKQHGVLANRIEEMLRVSNRMPVKELPTTPIKNANSETNFIIEKIPEKTLDSLLLPNSVVDSCRELVA